VRQPAAALGKAACCRWRESSWVDGLDSRAVIAKAAAGLPQSTVLKASLVLLDVLITAWRSKPMNRDVFLPTSEQSAMGSRDWPHAPPHRLQSAGIYFVTARTRHGADVLKSDELLDFFQQTLRSVAADFGWRLEAWAIFSNHYHLIAHSPAGDGSSLSKMIQKLHSLASKEINRHQILPMKRLWQNYRETLLTYQKSYLARLNYVHQNAVHHRLVKRASDWKWCSAAEFKKSVTPAWVKTIVSFSYDEIAKADGE
jgi:putative transposase